MTSSFSSFLERMTRREKILITALLGVFVVLALGLGTGIAVHRLGQVREEISRYQKALEAIKAAAPAYVEKVQRERVIEERIRNSRVDSLRIPVNNAAKLVFLQGVGGQTLSDVIRFDGKLIETPILIGAARKRKKTRDLKPGMFILQKDQEISIRDVSFRAFYHFLQELEQSKDLLFVTRLRVQRTFNDLEKGRVDMVVTTYTWPTGTE